MAASKEAQPVENPLPRPASQTSLNVPGGKKSSKASKSSLDKASAGKFDVGWTQVGLMVSMGLTSFHSVSRWNDVGERWSAKAMSPQSHGYV